MKLQDVLKQFLDDRFLFGKCPICCNRTLEFGEYLEMYKVSPDECNICGYQESNGTERYPDTTDFIEACWELQVAPYKSLEM